MARWISPAAANRALRALPDLAKAQAQRVQDETAKRVADGARRRAPVRTGRLKAAIDWRSDPKRVRSLVGVRQTRGAARAGEIFEGEQQDPFYWKYLEYGTVKMAARPMFRPAAEAVRSDHATRLVRALDDAAEEMVSGA